MTCWRPTFDLTHYLRLAIRAKCLCPLDNLLKQFFEAVYRGAFLERFVQEFVESKVVINFLFIIATRCILNRTHTNTFVIYKRRFIAEEENVSEYSGITETGVEQRLPEVGRGCFKVLLRRLFAEVLQACSHQSLCKINSPVFHICNVVATIRSVDVQIYLVNFRQINCPRVQSSWIDSNFELDEF